MRFRFRFWMPLLAMLLVLLSIASVLLYVLPATRSRLGGYVEYLALARAVAAANAVSTAEGDDLQRELDLAAETGGGEVLVVDRQGNVTASAGELLLSPPPEEILQSAANGERTNDIVGEQRVAVVPLIQEGSLEGGVVFAPGGSEETVYQLFLRSGVEAAAVAGVVGGGLALLLATLLSRRVERLIAGAQAIEGGNLSQRIAPGFDDELADLARTFNSMAGKLQVSFEKLKESGATLNAILNNLGEGVLATDLSGNVMFINLAARSMLGLGSEGPLDGPPNPWKDFDLPKAVARCAREQECPEVRVENGESFLQVKLEHLDKFDDHRGGVLVVIRDLSEGRRLEANQQRFLANAAHELKTPITTIVGASELLLTESEDDPEVRNRFLNHILSEARRMQRLSETLLRLARTGADLRDPNVEVVDLDGVAREAARRVEPLAESSKLGLRVESRGGRVWADYEWLEQALLVVLGNAIRHSERGSEIRLHAENNAVAVEDEGRGISKDDLPHVFERFYRGRQGQQGKASPGSFGLGLAICKDLVERMGGSIYLESEEGMGTRVVIELPEVRDGAEDSDS
ncbi:MAG: ATP-binding protein [Actinomycetota bacterium]|nr:ATP-binding protein [Actinomycetota bacterium]